MLRALISVLDFVRELVSSATLALRVDSCDSDASSCFWTRAFSRAASFWEESSDLRAAISWSEAVERVVSGYHSVYSEGRLKHTSRPLL